MRPPVQPTRLAVAGPVPDNASSAAAPGQPTLRAGLPRTLLTGWNVAPASAQQPAAAPVPLRAAPQVPFVAPLLSGVVRVNPLIAANSPQLFSSQTLADSQGDDANTSARAA